MKAIITFAIAGAAFKVVFEAELWFAAIASANAVGKWVARIICQFADVFVIRFYGVKKGVELVIIEFQMPRKFFYSYHGVW